MGRLLLLLVLSLQVQGVVFVEPDVTKSLFKRDRLPIDTDTMRSLSAQLTNLARRDVPASPSQWRATAQLLAIATHLDPSNRPARELGGKLAAGAEIASVDQARLNEAKAETWHILDWLLHPEAGEEGRRLGHQLLDALHVIDPNHPSAKRHDAAGEAERWEGVVAPVDRFRSEPKAGDGSASAPAQNEPAPEPPKPREQRPSIQLRETGIATPLFLYDRAYKQRLVMTRVGMTVQDREEAGDLTFSLTPKFDAPVLSTARERVRVSLRRTWPLLPHQCVAVLDTSGDRYASRNGTAIAGPASLLLHAAIAGKPLREDVVFLADLKSDGSLVRPQLSWDYLQLLRRGGKGRLLVSPDFQSELGALLVLQDPGFFLRWEVLVVRSVDAALGLASVDGDPESLVAASDLFDDIQRVGTTMGAGPLAVNTHARKRLAEIQEKAPFHLSASMLLLQGSGNRPTHLSRKVLARMIRSAIEPLSAVYRADTSTLNPDRLDAIFRAARQQLDPIARYVAKNDVAFHGQAIDLVNLVRTLARDQRQAAKSSSLSRISPERAKSQLNATHRALKSSYSKYLPQLVPYTGEILAPPSSPRRKTD